MKLLTLFILLQLSVFSFSQLTVMCIDGYKSTLFSECTVTLKDKRGKRIETVKPNKDGFATFNSNIKKGYLLDGTTNEKHLIKWASASASKTEDTTALIFYITDEFEKDIKRHEDEKYGAVKFGKTYFESDGYVMPKSLMEQLEKEKKLAKDSLTIVKEEKFSESTYVGGTKGMQTFLANNVVYPRLSIELGEQGKVFVEFIVQTDGTLTHITILRGVSKEIDREAIRVVRAMPKWVPAKNLNTNKNVKARCRIPLNFVIH